jgi:hypothetical protein
MTSSPPTAAKAETSFFKLLLPQLSQAGFSLPKTNASNLLPHFLHSYS